MVSQSKVVFQSHRQSLNGAVIWFQALWRKLKLLWDVVLLNAVTTEVGCDFRGVESLHLVNIISLQAQRGSGEGSPPTALTTTTPSNPLPLEHLPENQQPAEFNGDTDTETTISKQAKNKTGKCNCWFFFFFCHSQRKTNVLAAAEVTAPQKRKSSHLPAPFHVLWQNPDIANRTAVLFVESTGFSRRVRTQRAGHMRDFFFWCTTRFCTLSGPEKSTTQTRPGSPPCLCHTAVSTLWELYRRPAEVKRVNKSQALHQLVTVPCPGWWRSAGRLSVRTRAAARLRDLTWTHPWLAQPCKGGPWTFLWQVHNI